MSVLLRQPHGFEGLGRIHVDMPSDDPPPSKLPNVRDRFVDLHIALLAVAACLNDGHDVITAVDEAHGDVVDVPEDLEYLPPAAREAVVTVERSLGSEEGCALPDLDAWIEELQKLWIGQAFRPGEKLVVEPGNRLHVLLRHRPRSIPQAQESA